MRRNPLIPLHNSDLSRAFGRVSGALLLRAWLKNACYPSISAKSGAGVQSRRMSAVESVANVAVGFGVALLTQVAVFPLFGLHADPAEHVAITVIFTAVSLVRSYVLRRVFARLG